MKSALAVNVALVLLEIRSGPNVAVVIFLC